VKARRVEGLDPEGSLRSNAGRIVATRLDELGGFGELALDPAAATAQHDMRIAAKRLRYVLEITESCFGDEADAARRAVKELQSVLGDIHDYDVMLPRVDGIPSLTTLLSARREQLLRDFHDLWRAEASSGTWTALKRVL
jgi:CHAD domain-containing protein